MPMPRLASSLGSTLIRTAYFCEPKTCTWATPSIMEMRWAMMLWPYSSSTDMGRLRLVSDRKRMGWSAGLTLRKLGGLGISAGSFRTAREMAIWTSRAAASMLRLSENCKVIEALPRVLLEVMLSTPAMVENSFSSGVATAEAMVSALAPGNCALTWMVG